MKKECEKLNEFLAGYKGTSEKPIIDYMKTLVKKNRLPDLYREARFDILSWRVLKEDRNKWIPDELKGW